MTIAKIPFEDERVSKEQWKDIRDKTPFQAAPVLTVDGEAMAQSQAIERYLGKLGGLYPDDAFTAFKVDEVGDTIFDLWQSMYQYMGEDKGRFYEAREQFVKKDVPRFAGRLDKRLKLFGDGPWAVGDKVSLADVAITTFVIMVKCGVLDHVPKNLLDGYGKLIAVYEAVKNIPEVAEWYKEHPIKYFD